ncbi:MAG: allantoicase [Gammaproteobacteria bacterium]|nr:allantoicase [Gammaproteobacteria bacterium]MDH4314027.1 allantoicase [Gammaproteobacteria bacterium]MDH5213533.1 allantoicase [Gammaproteobacteria bacterium]MDH5501768.1 allantoicase [Gammaproteobacteria bacterium]
MNAKTESPFRHWVRLEQPRLGTRVVFATDDFFADKSRLIDAAEPVFIADKFDDHGKWMDGWESRRKRTPGHDYCVIRLGIPGRIHGVDIDTRHFTGNYPPQASIEACESAEEIPESGWQPLLPKVDLIGNSNHLLPIDNEHTWTHLRLNIFPDGGIARLRIYGEVRPDWSQYEADDFLDLLAIENGGRALRCNDEHFGSMHNLNVSGRGVNMGDGWETARRRVPGNDWVILALGHPGIVERVEIDTAHFKGNYPDSAALQAAFTRTSDLDALEKESEQWPLLLPKTRLGMDQQHFFDKEIANLGIVSHVRLSIYPDGGVSRLRVIGRRAMPEENR